MAADQEPVKRKRGRPPKRPQLAADDGFGYDPPTGESDGDPGVPAFVIGDVAQPPPPEILALGDPPQDAAGIQKWFFQVFSTMAALVLKDPTISNEMRMKRAVVLAREADRHYPDSAKYDLDRRIREQAEQIAGRKRAKAAGKMEARAPSGSAKVIPLHPDAETA